LCDSLGCGRWAVKVDIRNPKYIKIGGENKFTITGALGKKGVAESRYENKNLII
jgi:hypothetical protein